MAQIKYLDLTGLTSFWTKVKSYIDKADTLKVDKTTTVNGHALSDNVTIGGGDVEVGGSGDHSAKTVQKAIEDLDAAVKAAAAAGVQSIGGKTGAITLKATSQTNGDINLAISEGNELSASIVGLKSAAYTDSSDYAKSSHTHETSEVNGLDAALAEKATKTVALKDVKAAATADASNVTVTFTQTTESGTETSNNNFTLPVADESNQGTTTLGKIREIAKAEAATAAGSTYRVKGTKASIDEVLAVESAIVGDTYNVTAEFTLNSKKYPAGTNVVFIGDGTPEGTGNSPADQTQWDALGGTVDLAPYATKSYVDGELAKKANADAVVSSFGGQKGAITVDSDNAEGDGNGKVNFTMSGTELQGTVVGLKSAAYTDSSAYATAVHTHVTADITDLQGKLDAKLNITDLVAISEGEISGLPGLGA